MRAHLGRDLLETLTATPRQRDMRALGGQRARGGAADAQRIADATVADPERALAVLAREELGLNPDELGSPWGAANEGAGTSMDPARR